MSAVAPPQTQSTIKSQVYSVGCVKDGRAICACDIPAVRYISRTQLNPGRPFYRCSVNKCSFWRWESDLLSAGLIPPQAPSPPNSPRKQRSAQNIVVPIVPKRSSSERESASSAQNVQTPAKRSFVDMSAGSVSRMKSSDESRAHRLQLIEAALNAPVKEESAANDDDLRTTSVPAADSSQATHGRDTYVSDADAEDEEETLAEHVNREDGVSENDDSIPAHKKTRFVDFLKTETEDDEIVKSRARPQEQGQLPSTPPRKSSVQPVQLPTPSRTSERNDARNADYLSDDAGSASPTPVTKGGRTAEEHLRALADASGPGSRFNPPANKGKARVMEDVGGKVEGGNESQALHAPIFNESCHESDRESDSDRIPGSFAAQLASTIVRTNTSARTLSAPLKRCNRSSSKDLISSSRAQAAATTMLSTVSTMAAQKRPLQEIASTMAKEETKFQAALEDFTAEFDRLNRKLASLEKSLAYERRDKARLQEENEEIKKRLSELERFRDKMQELSHTIPPKLD